MWPFGKRNRAWEEARRQFALNALTPEDIELFERNELPTPIMESGAFRFLIFQVEAISPDETQAEFCRAVNGVLPFNGLRIALLSSLCFLVFRSKPSNPAIDEQDQQASLSFLRSQLGDHIKIVYGVAGGSMGLFGLDGGGHFGVMLHDFPRILQRLSNASPGSVQLYEDTAVSP